MPKHIDITEFREFGYLHEVNRLFFHPLGLALEITTPDGPDDPAEHISGVWDYRDDPEGILFDPSVIDTAKIARIQQQVDARRPDRERLLGFWIQEPDDYVPPEEEKYVPDHHPV
jgi:hypothetical protein